jgi:hypothetical protein
MTPTDHIRANWTTQSDAQLAAAIGIGTVAGDGEAEALESNQA